MKRFLLAVILAALASSARGTTSAAGQQLVSAEDTGTAAGYTLRLGERDGKCLVAHARGTKTGTLPLDLSAPCALVRDFKRGLLSHRYKAAGNATVLIVVGAIGDPKSKDPTGEARLGTQAQGILLRDQGLAASKRVARD